MRWTRRTFVTSTLASLATPAVLRLARADAPQLTLKLHHSFSAVLAVHEKFLAPWARKVEADSDGRLRIDLFPSMQLGGAPAHLLDQARDGVADIVWAVPEPRPGAFPRAKRLSCRSCCRIARWSIRKRSRISPPTISKTNSTNFIRS